MIKSFPKIFAIGNRFINKIFDDPVEITEKIDGSQFSFGKINGELCFKSKNKRIYPPAIDKMFIPAVEYVSSIEHKLPDNDIFHCEYLQKPKHNVLIYNRVPKNNLILFGLRDLSNTFITNHLHLAAMADALDIEVVPLLYYGMVEEVEIIHDLLQKESVLGGTKIEGVVVKNYFQNYLLGGEAISIMAGKYVSEKFKEKMNKNWKKENTGKGRFQVFKDNFRTEARWQKAIQYFKELDELEYEPRDIGKLIKRIQEDIIEEEKETIKNFLWAEFSKDILRTSIQGFPEWYKEQLLNQAFEKE